MHVRIHGQDWNAFTKVLVDVLTDLAAVYWARILVQVTIYRSLLIGRDGYLDQSEGYDIS